MSRKKAVIVFLAVCLYVFFPFFVASGNSMMGGIHDGDLLLGIRVTSSIRRGDIVVIYSDYDGEHRRLVKRVVGLSHDHVVIKDNTLSINGVELKEAYLYEPMFSEDLDVEVPEGFIFVLGDNRNISVDSRMFGCVDKDDLICKITFDISDIFR